MKESCATRALCEGVLSLLSLATAAVLTAESASLQPTCQRLASPLCRCNNAPSPPDVTCTLGAGVASLFNVSSDERLSIGTLDLSGSDLSGVKASLLRQVGSLNTLRAWRCGLKRIPRALLKVSGVQVLDVSFNNLTSLSLARLSVPTLLASHNDLQTITQEGQLSPTLSTVDLSHNRLASLPLSLWQSVQEVDVSHNALTQLPALNQTARLKHLDLSANSITQFPAHFLSFTPFLQELSLAGNRLEAWQPGTQQVTLNDLRQLDLSNNNIQQLSCDEDDPTLPFADLTPHWLIPAPRLAFSAAHLRSLNLSHNALHSLHPAAFRAFGQLRQLDLSHNALLGEEVTGQRVRNHLGLPQHLTLLDLSHCSFHDLDYCQLWHLHDLWHLHLDHNPLRCTCQLYALHHAHRHSPGVLSQPWTCVTGHTGPTPHQITQQMLCKDMGACLTQGQASQLHVTLTMEMAQHSLVVVWEMQDMQPEVRGFRVVCRHRGDLGLEETAVHTSPPLGPAARSYALTDIDTERDYQVCLDVMNNGSHALKRVCQDFEAEGPNVLIGILAGSVFLFPCLVFITYIAIKDRKVHKKWQKRFKDDTDNPACLVVAGKSATLRRKEGSELFPSYNQHVSQTSPQHAPLLRTASIASQTESVSPPQRETDGPHLSGQSQPPPKAAACSPHATPTSLHPNNSLSPGVPSQQGHAPPVDTSSCDQADRSKAVPPRPSSATTEVNTDTPTRGQRPWGSWEETLDQLDGLVAEMQTITKQQ